jgi:hypothetical protein
MNIQKITFSHWRIVSIAACFLFNCECHIFPDSTEYWEDFDQFHFIDSARILYIASFSEIRRPGGFGAIIREFEHGTYFLILRDLSTGDSDTLLVFESTNAIMPDPWVSYASPLIFVSGVVDSDGNNTVWYYDLELKKGGNYRCNSSLRLAGSPDFAFDYRGMVCHALTGKTAFVLPGEIYKLYCYDADNHAALFLTRLTSKTDPDVFHFYYGIYDPIAGTMNSQENIQELFLNVQVVDRSRSVLFLNSYTDTVNDMVNNVYVYSLVSLDSLDSRLTKVKTILIDTNGVLFPDIDDVLGDHEYLLTHDNYDCKVVRFNGEYVTGFRCR